MTLSALLAHTDPEGRVPPHVLHHVRRLRAAGADVVVVSRGPAPPEVTRSLQGVARWEQVGPGCEDLALLGHVLPAVDDGGDVIVATDRVVGPFGRVELALPACSPRHVVRVPALWVGGPAPAAVPSVLRAPAGALADPVVSALLWPEAPAPAPTWSDLVGVLEAGGLALRPVYRPISADVARARTRLAQRAARHSLGSPAGFRRAVRDVRSADLDPIALAGDAVLAGRPGYLDLETLRRTGRGGRPDLLAALERRHPEAVAGVRDVLARTPAAAVTT